MQKIILPTEIKTKRDKNKKIRRTTRRQHIIFVAYVVIMLLFHVHIKMIKNEYST